MFRSHLVLTLRHLWRHRGYTLLNLLGLGIGLAVALIAAQYIREELSFDAFHEKADRIVLLNQWEVPPDRDAFGSLQTPLGLGPSLAANFPEVEAASRVIWWNASVKYGEDLTNELIHYVDPGFFDVFSFQELHGDARSAIASPSRVILTKSAAERLLGSTPAEAVGQELIVQIGSDLQPMTVGAVLADPPRLSTLKFDILVSTGKMKEYISESAYDNWMWVHPYTFALVSEGVSIERFQDALPRLAEIHGFDERYGEGVLTYRALPWTQFRLHSPFSDGLMVTSRPAYLWALGSIGLLILLVAAVNYTTISIASSSRRTGEIGMRLMMGADKKQLRLQIFGESILLTLIALPVGVLFAELAKPTFASILGREIGLGYDASMLLMLLALVLVLGLTAGFYPALLLARTRPVSVLKGHATIAGNRRMLRSLVVLQFTVAISLICGSWMISKQIDFMIDRQLSSRGEQVLSIFVPVMGSEERERMTARLKEEFRTLPGVVAVTTSSNTLGWPWGWFGFRMEDGTYRSFHGNMVDESYVLAHGLNLLQGRNFEPGNSDDAANAVLVNETAVKEYGWQNPIGKTLPGPYGEFHVIGVVEDFHFHSLHSEIETLVLMMNGSRFRDLCSDVTNFRSTYNYLQLRLAPEGLRATIDRVESTFSTISDGQPYQAVFLDEVVQGMYTADLSVRNVIFRASILTVFIAMLGVLGLASLTVARRRRELTIRKVLGATLLDIQRLMTRDFVLLILVASVIAWPLTWYGINRWLAGFAYRTTVDVAALLLLSIGFLVAALLVVGTQSLRASLTNPAEILRDE